MGRFNGGLRCKGCFMSSATLRLTSSHVPCMKLHSSSIKDAYYMLCSSDSFNVLYIYIFFFLMGERNFLFLLRVSSKRDRKAYLLSK